MTDREQLLTIVAGRHPDRFPWVSRFQIWYGAQVQRGTLPEQYWGQDLRAIERDLGVGTPAQQDHV